MKQKALTLLLLLVTAGAGFAQTRGDAALRQVIDQDGANFGARTTNPTLPAAEHLRRAEIYSANRLFPQARAHWQKILDNYPNDAGMPKTLFGIARSYMWEREYEKAVTWFDRLTKDHLDTKDGREGLAFKGASYVRLGRPLEAATTYEQYTTLFPNGERIESSYLNIIDAYREAGRYDDANARIEKTRQKFAGKPSAVNALHARVRMEIFRSNWKDAVAAADDLLRAGGFAGSMASADETKYLKGLALEKLGRKADADAVYASIPFSFSSYYSGLAAEKLSTAGKVRNTGSVSPRLAGDYPVMYRTELLRHAKAHKIDPRFLLAIMKQESSFRANAKSPAGARGLLQLVFDTAIKYKDDAGYPNLQPDDLYDPGINVAIGSTYVKELKDEFGGLYEAIAASYNGGEDNAARWLNRSKPRDAGVFAAEVGFAETKNYVFKVMNNYRVYRELYTEQLNRK